MNRLSELIAPEPLTPAALTHEQLYERCRALLPATARVQIDCSIADGYRGPLKSVDVFVNLDGRELHVEAETCDEALGGVVRSVEELRFGNCELMVSA